MNSRRSVLQRIIEFFTMPFRTCTLFYYDRWGLSSLATDRFDYAARQVQGYCLDVGCGQTNRLIREYLDGNGKGVDIYPFKDLSREQILEEMTRFPFEDETFDSVTFLAVLYHVPESRRDASTSCGDWMPSGVKMTY